jgi:hypothetical protein
MPPSGFNQKAINGLLLYVQNNYQRLLNTQKLNNLEETAFLEDTISELELNIDKTEPSSAGLKIFIIECYKDLAREIYAGADKYNRPVQAGKALQKEIDQIREYLTSFKI